jgi:hypothetical protein
MRNADTETVKVAVKQLNGAFFLTEFASESRIDMMWAGLIWFRIGFSGGLFYVNRGLHEHWEFLESCTVVTSEEGLRPSCSAGIILFARNI